MASQKPESRFTAAVNRLLPAKLHHEKMHNIFRGGTADFWYSGHGNKSKDLWVEYKWLPKKPKINFKADLSALQLKWLRERYEEGRNVAVIVGCPDGVAILRDLEWESDVPSEFPFTKQTTAVWITKETNHVAPRVNHSSKSNVSVL